MGTVEQDYLNRLYHRLGQEYEKARGNRHVNVMEQINRQRAQLAALLIYLSSKGNA